MSGFIKEAIRNIEELQDARYTGIVRNLRREAERAETLERAGVVFTSGDISQEVVPVRTEVTLEDLIKGLAIQDSDPLQKDSLTLQLAINYNSVVGASLSDGISLRDIALPIIPVSRLTQDLQEASQLISPRRQAQYNRSLNALRHSGYDTVGEVRELDITDAGNIRNLSESTLALLQVAFKPVSPQE